MRKLFIYLAILASLILASTAWAVVAVEEDDSYEGEAVTLNFEGQGVHCSMTGSTYTVAMYANGHNEGVTTSVSSESNLTSAALAYGVIKKVGNDSTADLKVALANGTQGQMITIVITTACASSGDYVITDDGISSGVFTMTKTGWDDIALDAAYDSVTLLYVDDTYGWVIIGQNGASIT